MSLRSSVFIATSLDGFIARTDGGLDWLDGGNTTVPEGEENGSIPEGVDGGFQTFLNSIDVLIMGRKTYEKVLSFGRWPYGDKPVIVLSSNKIEIPNDLAKTVSWSSESPKVLSERLYNEGTVRTYVDGGQTIQQFLAEGLINDLNITIIPIILGGGIPLFGSVPKDIHLRHVATQTYGFGFVQITYKVENNE